MSNEKITQHRASGPSMAMSVAIAIGIVLLLVIAAKSLGIPVHQDLTGVSNAAPVVEDWKGNSGSIPQRPRFVR